MGFRKSFLEEEGGSERSPRESAGGSQGSHAVKGTVDKKNCMGCARTGGRVYDPNTAEQNGNLTGSKDKEVQMGAGMVLRTPVIK